MTDNCDLTRIVIADDHPVFRYGLRSVIEQEANLVVVGEAENGREAINLIESLLPDLVILDVDMPSLDGIEVARLVATKFPQIKTSFLTLHNNDEILAALSALNVRGYLLKDSALLEIVNCISQVMAGKRYVSPEVLDEAFSSGNAAFVHNNPVDLLATLTPTELRVLEFLSTSMTNRQIAEAMHISVRTSENHRNNICSKLNLRGNHALLKFAIENRTRLQLRSKPNERK